ncbi:MAG: uroporphyrinogen decarboxylase family protein [Xanthobacteraceae bacterium]
MAYQSILLPTTLVGSYPQPEWLIDRPELIKSVVRVQAEHLWRVPPELREQAQDDAIILAIYDQERAGLDIISDGEQGRESYSNHLAAKLDGVDVEKPGQMPNRFGKMIPVPRIYGKIRRTQPIELHPVKVVRANTDRMVKATVPGPFTMAMQSHDDFYKDQEKVAYAYAEVINEEIKDLFAAGADVVQVDEPWMVSFADKARSYGIKVLNRAIEGAKGKTAVHLCLGYAHVVKNKPSRYEFFEELEASNADQISIETAEPKLDLAVLKNIPTKTVILGVLNLGDMTVETPEAVADRIRPALKYIPAERLVIAPDCGMKYMPRNVAFGKMKAMVDGTKIVRKELGKS